MARLLAVSSRRQHPDLHLQVRDLAAARSAGALLITSNMAWRDTGSPAMTRTSTQLRTSDFMARSQNGSPPRPCESSEPIDETSMKRLTRFSVSPAPAPGLRHSCCMKLKLHPPPPPNITRSAILPASEA